jgi:uncharacterized Zn finger protein (UPF0148 family)
MSDTPRTDSVICPNCVHQFVAIPEDVQEERARLQRELAEAQRTANQWRDEALYNRTFREQVTVAADQRNAAESDREQLRAATVDRSVYESAVRGRQQFRESYRVAREALVAADAAINPPDRSGISLDEWNKRLKAATATIRRALSEPQAKEGKHDA